LSFESNDLEGERSVGVKRADVVEMGEKSGEPGDASTSRDREGIFE
jgi:hypothetical protein